MVAAVTDLTGSVVGAHRTYLAADGGGKASVKTPKKTLGAATHGMRLSAKAPLIRIGEGVETVLSAATVKGLDAAQYVAASAGLLGKWETPPWCERLEVYADSDEVGRKAASELGRKAKAGGKTVKIFTPAGVKDFNDLLRQRGVEAIRAIEGAEPAAPAASEAGCEERHKPNQADLLVQIGRSAKLFHDGDATYGTFDGMADPAGYRPAGQERWETQAIRSKGFRRWLIKRYLDSKQTAPNAENLACAINTLDALAHYRGEERKVFLRVGGHDGKLYLDLCDAEWRIVEIDAAGWRVIKSKDCPVRFRRTRGMLALPAPESGGKLSELRRFVNVASRDDFILLLAALVSFYRDTGPYPVLCLTGEHGSAKSTATSVLRLLIDPNEAPLRAAPKELRDLAIAANNSWVYALNNLSNMPDWLSDALSCLSTGSGFATRELHTDTDEVILAMTRPSIVNGIDEIARRPDLADRVVALVLPHMPASNRRDEITFYTRFNEARPRILGALLTAVSTALRNISGVNLDELPRMADFAKWAVAAEPALPCEPGTFMRAYSENRDASSVATLEASVIAEPITRLQMPVTSTATELLALLDKAASDDLKKRKSWPKSGQSLANALRRLAPSFATIGVQITFHKPGRSTGGRRLIGMARVATPTAPTQSEDEAYNDRLAAADAEGRDEFSDEELFN